MFSDNVLVNSNFPDVLSTSVEYTVFFQILTDERTEAKITYHFLNEDILKRVDKKEEMLSLFYDDVYLSFVINKPGVHTFQLFIDDIIVYEKEFIAENIFDITDEQYQPECFCSPKCITLEQSNNNISFLCDDINTTENCIDSYYKDNKVYCGIKYTAPPKSTHWRTKTTYFDCCQDTGYTEFTNSDGNVVEWYFPVISFEKDDPSILSDQYIQSIGFYTLVGNEYVELSYNTYNINIAPKNEKSVNSNVWNEEILKLLYYIREGYQSKDLIRKYGVWHSLSESEIKECIRQYKDNFGEFALHKGLITTHNQVVLLNYATHYTLIDSIIKLGITDLKQTREDFQDLMLQAHKGISEVLPQIK